jgi:hypothetical protein
VRLMAGPRAATGRTAKRVLMFTANAAIFVE